MKGMKIKGMHGIAWAGLALAAALASPPAQAQASAPSALDREIDARTEKVLPGVVAEIRSRVGL